METFYVNKKGESILSKKRKYSKLTTAEKSKLYEKRVKTILKVGKLSLYATAVALGIKAGATAYNIAYTASTSVGKFGYVNDATNNYLKEEYAWIYPLIEKAIDEFDLAQTDEKIEAYVKKEIEHAKKIKAAHMRSGAKAKELEKYDVDEEQLRHDAVNEVKPFERE